MLGYVVAQIARHLHVRQTQLIELSCLTFVPKTNDWMNAGVQLHARIQVQYCENFSKYVCRRSGKMQILCVEGGEMLASSEKRGIESQPLQVGKCNAINP